MSRKSGKTVLTVLTSVAAVLLIPVCIQDDTMIYNRHGGAPCRDKQISVRKK